MVQTGRWILRCRLQWGSAPWRTPSQQNHRHLSMTGGLPPRHGAGGHWPPFSGDRTWRRPCYEDQSSVHYPGLRAPWSGPTEEHNGSLTEGIVLIIHIETWWNFSRSNKKERGSKICWRKFTWSSYPSSLARVNWSMLYCANALHEKREDKVWLHIHNTVILFCFKMQNRMKLTEMHPLWEDYHCWAVSAHLKTRMYIQ